MKCSLISINKIVFENDNIFSILLPTENGQIGIWENHEPLITTVKPGVIFIEEKAGDVKKSFAIGKGLVQVADNKISIIADMVDTCETDDIEEIKKRKQEAEKLMEEYNKGINKLSMEEFIEIEEKYLRESAREMVHLARK